MSDLTEIRDAQRAFIAERDWEQFQDPKSLVLALVGEVGELAELFQWLPADRARDLVGEEPLRTRVAEEMADVLVYLVGLADQCGVELGAATLDKIEKSGRKHPSAQVAGRAPSKVGGPATDSKPWPHVLGVDARKGGWVGVELDGYDVRVSGAVLVQDLISAVAGSQALEAVGIDIPIGLPDSGRREADRLARTRLGARASTVFSTPIRQAIEAETYTEANEMSRSVSGMGLGAQSYGLRTKLLEVDRYVRREGSLNVLEVHPEVSFAAMTGHALPSKKTEEGRNSRVAALASVGIVIDVQHVRDLKLPVEDVLDAAAAAWSAARAATGAAESLPAVPETFSDGLQSAIWV